MNNTQNKSFFFSGYEIKNINAIISLFKSSIKYQTEFIKELEQNKSNLNNRTIGSDSLKPKS